MEACRQIPCSHENLPTETALYAVEFIAGTPVEKLYTFTLKEEVLAELVQIAEKYRRDFLPGEFHTLEILETL